MRITRRLVDSVHLPTAGVVVAVLALGIASCQSPHNPQVTEATKIDDGWPKGDAGFQQVSYGRLQVELPQVANAELVNDDELCMTCHEAYTKTFQENVHRALKEGQSCESCHGPASRHLETRGKEPGLILSFKTMDAAEKSEVCLKCHEENQCDPGAQFRYSKHAHCGVACTDCHTGHYNVPAGTPATTEPGVTDAKTADSAIQLTSHGEQKLASLKGTSNSMGAVAPNICYQCHCDMKVYQDLAGPHQICGPNGFSCDTCHDPHGKIVEYSRKELCLQCHSNDSPTMAFCSSIHNHAGVACTDCHNPHPNPKVRQVVNISHTSVNRPKRLPMSVEEPEACYKCHPEIFGKTRLPSHHPLQEGKMTCSDCHDAHGQAEGNLKAETLNLLCYKCHAEKQGPFVYEHPPVTEDCSICHEAHGTVANSLLKQPATFLCLRCHNGHRQYHSGTANAGININLTPNLVGFYADCARCHNQIHGSDRHGPVRSHDFMR